MLAPLALFAALHAAPAADAPPSDPALPDPSPAPPPRIDLPDPTPVPRATFQKARRRIPYYGVPRPLRLLGLRLGLGLGARLAGPPSDRAHFALDLLPTARLSLHRGELQAAMFPVLGYSLGAGKVTLEHFLVAGLGLGGQFEDGALAVIPALLVGAAERTRVLGLRTALVLDAFRKGLYAEVAHQVLWLDAGLRHELRLVVGIDLRKAFVK